jgi:hypothetical protein
MSRRCDREVRGLREELARYKHVMVLVHEAAGLQLGDGVSLVRRVQTLFDLNNIMWAAGDAYLMRSRKG